MLMSLPMIFTLTGILLLLVAGAVAGLGIWTYRDAKARGLEAGLWTAIVVLVPNMIGLLLYFMLGRKHPKAACPACGGRTETGKAYCGDCGAALFQNSGFPPTPRSASRKPLIWSLVCIVLLFFLVAGAVVAMVASSPETFTARNISIGQTQTMRPGVWKLGFWYFDGEKARAIKLKESGAQVMHVEASIQSGTVEMGISMNGEMEKRISLNELDSPYVWDLSDYPANARLSLRLYADKAKGKLNLKWDQ